ncbi:MAG: hypothetical protein ACP5XB_30835 [Isosphaeraceae bacterium]
MQDGKEAGSGAPMGISLRVARPINTAARIPTASPRLQRGSGRSLTSSDLAPFLLEFFPEPLLAENELLVEQDRRQTRP